MSNESFGNSDPQRGARDADAMQNGEKDGLKNLGKLSNTLSNDENGFSNSEGFNTDRGHEALAGSGGSQTSDFNSIYNAHDLDENTDFQSDSSENYESDSVFGDDSDYSGDDENIRRNSGEDLSENDR